ncbi:MAG: GntR family transcriptional regulator, partial [Desulfitobacteriaceae bacterium]|nr:GntR family transcriptional regulator [Desulfitobacteriaceae bacterium]
MYSITRVNSLKEQVLDTLRKEILRGNIKSGDFLVESELARKFNISRGPIREAISILESDGLIKKNESGQIYVT